MDEIWKDIPSRPGWKASSHGRIMKPNGQMADLFLDPSTYYVKVKEQTMTTVHSLVAEAFLGERPEGYDTDHINERRLDNRSLNLRYITHGANTGRGHINQRAIKHEGELWLIRKLVNSGLLPQWRIAEMFRIKRRMVSKIKLEKFYLRDGTLY
jgi:hypothetical protein